MVGVEDLKYLNTQIWVCSGEECAKRLFTTQSTVSRRNAETLKIFGLKIKRDSFGEWVIKGESALLYMERKVHEEYRLHKDEEKLCLEENFWAGPTLSNTTPEGWINGVWDHVGMTRPLHLLREGIIDAWIGSYQTDLREKNNPEFIVIDLCKNPIKFVADKLHPLSGKENICKRELEAYPSLSLPEGWVSAH